MTGKELKEKLKGIGVNFTDLSKKIGLACSQNLHSMFDASDVKSGTIESIAKAINKPVSWFYEDNDAPFASGDKSYLLDHIATQKEYISTLKEQIRLLQKENESLKKTKKAQDNPAPFQKYD